MANKQSRANSLKNYLNMLLQDMDMNNNTDVPGQICCVGHSLLFKVMIGKKINNCQFYPLDRVLNVRISSDQACGVAGARSLSPLPRPARRFQPQ